MKINEIEIGKEYVPRWRAGGYSDTNGTFRIRADAIEQVQERGSRRTVRMVRFTPLDEKTGEPHAKAIEQLKSGREGSQPFHMRATQLVELWETRVERLAEHERAENAHVKAVAKLDGALRGVGIEAVRFGEAGFSQRPAVSVVLTYEQIAKLCEELEG